MEDYYEVSSVLFLLSKIVKLILLFYVVDDFMFYFVIVEELFGL